MTDGQKIVLHLFVFLCAVAAVVSQHLLFGRFNMGSRAGSIGLMAIILAFVAGALASSLYRSLT
ncbi:hypothetical protein [Rhizobium terrae]|uniref:hypothetical protein n=1 Tax=Rhizobium terrae TaxID=2171756 RepID=UPI000E3CBFA8|nr:hypothetical protein [Rhizobium terrae]